PVPPTALLHPQSPNGGFSPTRPPGPRRPPPTRRVPARCEPRVSTPPTPSAIVAQPVPTPPPSEATDSPREFPIPPHPRDCVAPPPALTRTRSSTQPSMATPPISPRLPPPSAGLLRTPEPADPGGGPPPNLTGRSRLIPPSEPTTSVSTLANHTPVLGPVTTPLTPATSPPPTQLRTPGPQSFTTATSRRRAQSRPVPPPLNLPPHPTDLDYPLSSTVAPGPQSAPLVPP
ncbi:hypothetical protein BJ085DRAFT_7533, partial [Dimargaris cristalligena]